jgi:hypothetical protein
MTEAATPIAPQYEDALQPGATRPLPSVEPPVGLKLPLDRDTAREFLAPDGKLGGAPRSYLRPFTILKCVCKTRSHPGSLSTRGNCPNLPTAICTLHRCGMAPVI